MFFVLSGFVITRILINTRDQKGFFINFYWKRALRILPLYYLFLFVYYLVADQFHAGSFQLHLPFYLYYQNFTEIFNINASGPGHYWSLAVEEHFYMLWPMAVYFIAPKKLGKFILFIICSIFILKYYLLENGFSINKFTFTRIDQILIGSYLALLEKKNFFLNKNSSRDMLIIIITVLPLAVLIYLGSRYNLFIKEMAKYTLLGMLFFGLIGWLIAIKENHIVNKLLSGKLLQYLGRISYGIYIWHVLILGLLNKYLITKVLIIDLFLSVLFTILIAHLSFYYFEKQILKLKEKKPVGIKVFQLSKKAE